MRLRGHVVEQTIHKTCVFCGGDCSQEQRIRDGKGRYFHEDCYAWVRKRGRHLARRNGTSLKASAKVLEEVIASPEDTAESDSEESAIFGMAPQGCPRCGKPVPLTGVICTQCGYNLRTRQKLATAWRRPVLEGETDRHRLLRLVTDPGNIGLAILGVFIVMFISAMISQPMGAAYVRLTIIYGCLVALGLVVSAFRSGIADGLLTLLLPFYALYYLVARCPHVHVRVHSLVWVITAIGAMVLWIQDLVLAAASS